MVDQSKIQLACLIEENVSNNMKIEHDFTDSSDVSYEERHGRKDHVRKQYKSILPKDVSDGEDENCYLLVIDNHRDDTNRLEDTDITIENFNNMLSSNSNNVINFNEDDNGDKISRELDYSEDTDSSQCQETHQENGTFISDCDEQFEDIHDCNRHTLEHNAVDEQLCNICGRGFETAEILTGHMLLHSTTDLLIKCPFCSHLVKRNGLTQHIKYSHNNPHPYCNICSKTFANQSSLNRHLTIHSGTKEFECDICLKQFNQKINMQMHRLIHIHPYSCDDCDKTFQNKSALIAHKTKVVKVKEDLMGIVKKEVTTNLGKLLGFACMICKKMFFSEAALEQHVESTHIVDQTDLLCPECGEILPNKRDMRTHTMIHRNLESKKTRRFKCNFCSKRFSSHAKLSMHERVHTNERPFPCQLCSLRFKTKTHLRTHQLTHTREKKFSCSVCSKTFALKGSLTVHVKIHRNKKL